MELTLRPALTQTGLSATSYGLYQFYQSFTAYPSPVRAHLRSALRSQSTSSYPRADTSFAAAYDLALDLASRGELGTAEQALMRTTGIVIRWGGMWEEAGELDKAVEVYEKGFEECRRVIEEVQAGRKEVMRGVAIAMKIGDLWMMQGGSEVEKEKEAEKKYVFCVEEMMRLNMSKEQLEKVGQEMEHGEAAVKAEPEGGQEETDLPAWASQVELVAGLERLGDLYARMEKVE
jgi:hypothetical protein